METMKPPKPYRIDNKPASGHDIVQAARKYGYDEGFVTEASKILRNHGHEVMTNQAYAG